MNSKERPAGYVADSTTADEVTPSSQTIANAMLAAVSPRDYFAAQAMLAVMQETQEMRINSFWDWCKMLMVTYLHFNFLHVKYVKVKDVYKDAAERAFEYADAMMSARNGS